MATIKPTMTTAKINEYLKKYKNITFNPGIYDLTASLIVYSECKITCKEGAIFTRKHKDYMVKMYNSKDITEYNGCHDTTWKGGLFIADTDPSNCNIFNFAHNKNITLDGIIMEGCIGYHTIELNSSSDITIKNCTIKRQTGESYREGIQIDFAYKGGVGVVGRADPHDPCYDYTHCKNITISNCIFEDCQNGIGTHVVSDKELYHENITIKNCTFTNIAKNGIQLLGMKNVTIKGCDTKVLVNKKKEGYDLDSNKVKLKEYRCCENISIGNIKVV